MKNETIYHRDSLHHRGPRGLLVSALLLGGMFWTLGCDPTSDQDEFTNDYDDDGSEELANDRQLEPLELPPAQASGDYAVLLIDRTGSMNTLRATGNTRCEDAKIMAKGAIADFFAPVASGGQGGAGLAIWGFTNTGGSGNDVQPAGPHVYYDNAAAASAAVDTISCSGSTPLADALCKAIEGNGETFTLFPPPSNMIVLTDGMENASNGPCDGPTSGDIFAAGSWENKVFMHAINHQVRLKVRYYVNPTLLLQPNKIDSFTTLPSDSPTAVEEELTLMAELEGVSSDVSDSIDDIAAELPTMKLACNNTACLEINALQDMAEFTGGDFGVVTNDNTDLPVAGTMDPPSGPVDPNGGGGGDDDGWW